MSPYAASPATLPTASLDNPPGASSAPPILRGRTPLSAAAPTPSQAASTPLPAHPQPALISRGVNRVLVGSWHGLEGRRSGEIDRYERGGEGDISLWELLCARTTRAVGLIAVGLLPSSLSLIQHSTTLCGLGERKRYPGPGIRAGKAAGNPGSLYRKGVSDTYIPPLPSGLLADRE